MSKVATDRLVLALTDAQLEQFVLEWVGHLPQYVKSDRFSGAGDRGRDVVGYFSAALDQGAWDNYQCKQYNTKLGTTIAIREVVKVLYYAFLGEFTAPLNFVFVAPRGLNRNLERLIFKPNKFKQAILDEWDELCAPAIIDGQTVPLTSGLRQFIEGWDFSKITRITVDGLLASDGIKPVLQSWFGIDPGAAPIGVVPPTIEEFELPYINQLVDAYAEREGCSLSHNDALAHATHGGHLKMQRERFFDAASFKRFYRDNTMHKDIEILERDVFHGVDGVHRKDHKDSLERADAVLTQAAVVTPSGALAKHARVTVKQGICHHFANDGALTWKK